MADDLDQHAMARWRLLLGQFADPSLGGALGQEGQAGGKGRYRRMDQVLDYLYGREYAQRGVRSDDRSGGDNASVLTIPDWLHDVRELFPQDTVEIIERHALD